MWHITWPYYTQTCNMTYMLIIVNLLKNGSLYNCLEIYTDIRGLASFICLDDHVLYINRSFLWHMNDLQNLDLTITHLKIIFLAIYSSSLMPVDVIQHSFCVPCNVQYNTPLHLISLLILPKCFNDEIHNNTYPSGTRHLVSRDAGFGNRHHQTFI